MKSAGASLITLLNGGQAFSIAELYTITLKSGTVLRYAVGDGDMVTGNITYSGNTYTVTGPLIERGEIACNIGASYDSVEVTVHARSTDLIGSTPWLQALRTGILDGAVWQIDSLYYTVADSGGTKVFDYTYGTIRAFGPGVMADIVEMGRERATFNVKDYRVLLDTQLPRQYYQPPCGNVLFDTACGLSAAAFAVSGTAASGSTASVVNSALTQASGWFSLGRIVFTSGANSGFSAAVKYYAGGSFQLMTPLPAAPAVGDAFTAYPGCQKTKAACENTNTAVGPAFNNITKFRGMPYVPRPEVAV